MLNMSKLFQKSEDFNIEELKSRYQKALYFEGTPDRERISDCIRRFFEGLEIQDVRITFINNEEDFKNAARDAMDARAARAAMDARAARAAMDAMDARAARAAMDARAAMAAMDAINFFGSWWYPRFDLDFEASFVFSEENFKVWLPFFEACEAGLMSLYVGLDNQVYVLEWPSLIVMDPTGNNLHNTAGPALRLGEVDFYYWFGILIPERAVKDIESYKAQEIITEENAEVRRALMSLYGWERILPEVNAKIIDEHPHPTIGRLYEFNIGEDIFHVVECHDPGHLFGKEGGMPFNCMIGTRTSLRSVVESLKDTYPQFRKLSNEAFVKVQKNRT